MNVFIVRRSAVGAMLPTFTQWCDRWLKFATVSAWFAAFLPTGGGQVLLPMGIKKLAVAAISFSNHDWGQKGLGGLLTGGTRGMLAHTPPGHTRRRRSASGFPGLDDAIMCATDSRGITSAEQSRREFGRKRSRLMACYLPRLGRRCEFSYR